MNRRKPRKVDLVAMDAELALARSNLTGPARESDCALQALWMVGDALRQIANSGFEREDAVHWRLRDAMDLLAYGERREAFRAIPSPHVTLERFDGLL